MVAIPRRLHLRNERAIDPLTRLFESADLLNVETLEARQMLSSTVLSQAELATVAIDHLRDNAAEYGLAPQDLNEYVLTDQYSTEGLNVSHIYLRQKHNGLEIRDANINANVGLDGQFISAGNRFLTGVWDDDVSVVPRISAENTLFAAIDHYGWEFGSEPILVSAANDPAQSGQFLPGDIAVQNINYELEFVPVEGQLELAWSFEIRRPNGEAWYHSSFSANDGRLMAESNWIDDAIYNVLDRPIDSPLWGSQSWVVDPNDRITSPYGWHDLDGLPGIDTMDTTGNNVFAQLNRFATGDGTGPRANGGVNLEFYGEYNFGAQPVVSKDAVTTNLFYWNNLLHDIHYQYGFNEQAGNFQFNNYANGGLGGDPVLADAQYGARLGLRNNAFFATPPDGEQPHMAMFEWTFTLPFRDSAFENTIIVHEYGHGVSNRLTGGPSNADALEHIQSGGMGEGWSDFYALMINQEASDRANDAYPLGNWVIGDDFIFTPGVRRVFYSFDMDIDPHTFATYNGSQQVHDAGEIWASVLWDLNWFLIDGQGPSMSDPDRLVFPGYGFDSDLYHGTGGNNIALQLVMDGMKLQPSNPSFLEARDAILLADQLRYGGANQIAIWTAFARRGMGYSAQDGGSRSLSVSESFDLPDLSNGIINLDLSVYELGDDKPIKITLFDVDLANTGSAAVILESDGGDLETILLTEVTPGFFRADVELTAAPIFFGDGRMNARGGDTITVSYFDADNGLGESGIVTDAATITGGGGITVKTYIAADTPVVVDPDSTGTSTVVVGDSFAVGDVNVQVTIAHPDTSQITLTLVSPGGARVLLADGVGNSNDFVGTTFDDEATSDITSGTNPFSGAFRPVESLSSLDGSGTDGPWSLEVRNESGADDAVIVDWSLTIVNGGGFISTKTYVSNDVPTDITGNATVTSTIDVSDGFSIDDLNVNLTITHFDTSDLVLTLIGPNGTRVLLANGVGDDDDFVNTRFDDEAVDSITMGANPFTGSFMPEESLTAFDGLVVQGEWTLEVVNSGNAAGTIDSWSITIANGNFGPKRFDFGWPLPIQPVARGFVPHTSEVYDPAVGYGWLSGKGANAPLMRVDGSSLSRDFVYLRRGIFVADLPAGIYDVTFYVGDTLLARDQMGLFLENKLVDTVSTAAGEIATRIHRVTVEDGQLFIGFRDFGGATSVLTLVGLEIDAVDKYRFDFGTVNSPVEDGYFRADASAFDAARGYGWLGDVDGLAEIDRGVGSDLERDLNILRSGSYAVRLPNGSYDVSIYFGDLLSVRDVMGVFIEGTYIEEVTANAGQIVKRDYTVDVSDGELTIFFQDLGGADQYVAIVALDVIPTGQSSLVGGGSSSNSFDMGSAALVSPNTESSAIDLGNASALPSKAPSRIAGFSRRERQLSVIDFAYYTPIVGQDETSLANESASLLSAERRWKTQVQV